MCPRCNGSGRVGCTVTHTLDDGNGHVLVVGEEPGTKACPACTSVTGDDLDYTAA